MGTHWATTSTVALIFSLQVLNVLYVADVRAKFEKSR